MHKQSASATSSIDMQPSSTSYLPINPQVTRCHNLPVTVCCACMHFCQPNAQVDYIRTHLGHCYGPELFGQLAMDFFHLNRGCSSHSEPQTLPNAAGMAATAAAEAPAANGTPTAETATSMAETSSRSSSSSTVEPLWLTYLDPEVDIDEARQKIAVELGR